MSKSLEINKIDKCKYCGIPLGNVHALRQYCPNTITPDGSVKSCKDDYHNERKKPQRDMTKNISRIHYNNFLILEKLYKGGKSTISWDGLAKEGFRGGFCLIRKRIKDTHIFDVYYFGYLLRQLDETNLKIIPHAEQF